MKENVYGFVAFWKATDSWFSADKETKEQFMVRLKEVVDGAREKGIQTFGNFDCSWSCEWRYFTFWLSPNIEVLQETMDKLVKIGDINHFNIQHHYVGLRTMDEFVQ